MWLLTAMRPIKVPNISLISKRITYPICALDTNSNYELVEVLCWALRDGEIEMALTG